MTTMRYMHLSPSAREEGIAKLVEARSGRGKDGASCDATGGVKPFSR
jgi:hypothetical protein